MEPASLSASPSQGKPCLAPCYFWLRFCLWDPLTFSNENKTTEGCCLSLWLAASNRERQGLKSKTSNEQCGTGMSQD